MNLSKRILLVVMSMLIIVNVTFIIKDIQTEVKANKATIQSVEKDNTRILIQIEKNIKNIEKKIEASTLSTKIGDAELQKEIESFNILAMGRDDKLEKNLPSKIKQARFALEQKLIMINIHINNKTAGALGSGVSIKYKGKFYVLTAGHLAAVIEKGEKQDELELMENDKKICDLEVVKHDFTTNTTEDNTKGTDLLLLKSKDENITPTYYVDLDAQEPILGTEVYIVGNPMGIDDVVSMGRVIFYKNNFMYITDSIYFGNSGGGVYSIEGNLLGIVSHMSPLQPDKSVPPYMIYGIVRMNTIKEFMRGVE